MGLASNLKKTSKRLINKYGNTIVLATVTNDGLYNPNTGSYGTPLTVTLSKKGITKSITTEELSGSGIPDNLWGSIKSTVTFVQDADTLSIDNTWTIDGSSITKIVETKAQDVNIIIKAYVG